MSPVDTLAAQARAWLAEHWDHYEADARAPTAAFDAACSVVQAEKRLAVGAVLEMSDVAGELTEEHRLATHQWWVTLAFSEQDLNVEWADIAADAAVMDDAMFTVVAWYLVNRPGGLLDDALALAVGLGADDEREA